jgi:hypothetical protein
MNLEPAAWSDIHLSEGFSTQYLLIIWIIGFWKSREEFKEKRDREQQVDSYECGDTYSAIIYGRRILDLRVAEQ